MKRIRQASFQYGEVGSHFSLITQQLNKKIPVGIMYNVCKFTNDKDDGDCGHASTLVGRRRNPKSGSCEYMIRNSWGPSCKPYKKGVPCIDGYYWAKESTLKQSLGGFAWIDDPH